MTEKSMKIYLGQRDDDGKPIVTVDGRLLPTRNDLRDHSPSGFEWGYPGSGPAQLALAILADFLGDDELAQDLHQFLKRDVIAKLPQPGFMLGSPALEKWLVKYAEERLEEAVHTTEAALDDYLREAGQ